MFFRKTIPSDFQQIQNIIPKEFIHLEIYLIEDHTGILGIGIVEENTIVFFQCGAEHQDAFLHLLEELLFMKFNSIFFKSRYEITLLKEWKKLANGDFEKHKKLYNPYHMEIYNPERYM
ncbi:MAG: hypothetical protein ACRCTQ_01885 [Brevinemataceae bacterium]